MPEPVTLRRAVAADQGALVAMQMAAYEPNRAIIGGTPTPLTWDYGAILAAREVWLAEDGEGIAGALILEPRAADLYIESIAVAPRAKRGGIGNMLLAHAEARAEAGGYGVLRLVANARMVVNVDWYARKGFAIETIEDDGGRRRVFMAKMLANPASGAPATR